MKEKLDLQSPHIVNQNIEQIAKLFPNCITETEVEQDGESRIARRIDFGLLKQELNDDIVEGTKERYRLEWPGKKEAIVTANLPTNKTLRPVREDSVSFDSTENLYIEGDNLEVLKLLQESYLRKVKMIYIDPPYNTGHDFVYKDNFSRDRQEELFDSGQRDEEGQRLVANLESNGRYHSDWLSMMYPRLKLARNLLKEDGVIFISIDDHEVHNLRKICDEIFGEGNFIESDIIINNPRGRQSDTFIATTHEYIILYAKNSDKAKLFGKELTKKQKSEFNSTDKKGDKYRLLGLRQRGAASRREDRPDMYFPIFVNPKTLEISIDKIEGWEYVLPKKSDGSDSRWMWGKKRCKSDINLLQAKLIKQRGEFDLFVKDYLNKGKKKRTRKFKSVWDSKLYNNQIGTQEVKKILNGNFMSFPKPTPLVKDNIIMGTETDDIILDFFSGSGTTAHAAMQQNAEDDGDRKYIMVQLPEATDEKSEAYKAGYKTIAEIGKERIRRAGKRIVADQFAKIEEKKEKLEKMTNSQLLMVNDELSMPDGARNSDGQDIEKYAFPEAAIVDDPAKKLLEEINHLQAAVNNLDTGFRVYRLDSSNMQDVYYKPQDYKQENLDLFADNVKPDRSADDLLAQVMLDWGLPLDLKITSMTLSGKQVFRVAGNSLYACFDTGIDEDFARALAQEKPLRVVFKDSSFKDDTAKVNVRQLLKQLSPMKEDGSGLAYEIEMRVI